MQLIPYLRFTGNCREAMNFYRDSFNGDLSIQSIGESPMAAQMPAEIHNQIMHSTLTVGGTITLMASDMAFQDFVKGNDVTLMVDCKSDAEINVLFERLSAGGEVFSPLKKEFWGATFGQFKDKFGFIWMLNYDGK